MPLDRHAQESHDVAIDGYVVEMTVSVFTLKVKVKVKIKLIKRHKTTHSVQIQRRWLRYFPIFNLLDLTFQSHRLMHNTHRRRRPDATQLSS